MNQESSKIKSFTDLFAWKEGHKLVIDTYRVIEKFPNSEIFCLTNQLRRAVVSITSNIAEGFSRQSYKEKVQFYRMALGSLTEVQNQLLIARDIGYVVPSVFQDLANQSVVISKLLNGLIKSSKTIIHNT